MVARGFQFLIRGLQLPRLVMMNRSRDFSLLGVNSALSLLAEEGHLTIRTPMALLANQAHGVLDRGSRPPILPALAAQVFADCATAKYFEYLGSATSATAVMVARGFTFLVFGLRFPVYIYRT